VLKYRFLSACRVPRPLRDAMCPEQMGGAGSIELSCWTSEEKQRSPLSSAVSLAGEYANNCVWAVINSIGICDVTSLSSDR
jgi:hypothetical protein